MGNGIVDISFAGLTLGAIIISDNIKQRLERKKNFKYCLLLSNKGLKFLLATRNDASCLKIGTKSILII